MRPFYTTAMACQLATSWCNVSGDPSDVSSSDNASLFVVSYNMHGFNQGSHTVRDLINESSPDIFLLQEHWLTPANLGRFDVEFPGYVCFGSSAMRSCVESGVLYGRPFGGVTILVNKRLQQCTEILCCSDRYVAVTVGNVLIFNIYLPCVGTPDRQSIVDQLLLEIHDYMSRYRSYYIILGGDFNTDLDKHSQTSLVINQFSDDNALYRCDSLFGSCDKQYTYYNEAQGSGSTIDYFLINVRNAVSLYEVINRGSNLSDHSPICIKCSGVCLSNNRVIHSNTKDAASGEANVKQLRWDHSNLPLYRDTTGLYLYNIYQDLTKQALDDSVTPMVIDNCYSKIVDALTASANLAVPACRRNFYKFWWDHSLDELKEKSVASCNIWRDSGRPRSGPIFDHYRKDKAAYRHEIRNKQRQEKEIYTNELHEALLQKQGNTFWKCWGRKFERNSRSINHVNGVTDHATIAEHFVSHFSRACTVNTAAGDARLKGVYCDMRVNYRGCVIDDSYTFDAELVEKSISKMKRGKAADLDGLMVEHLYYSHCLLSCILAKLFNMMMHIGHVPLRFGESYTVPILKNSDSVYSKSVTVDDFRGISISPTISKVFEHCILDRYADFLVTSDNQFGFKKNSSCAHAIYSMRCVVDYYVEFGSTVNLCALDISKAFDKMNHYGLFIKLMKKHVPINLLRVLEMWFAIGSTCVKWCNFFSRSFVLSCGVRQGGVLSPYLFALYIDSIFDKVKRFNFGCNLKWFCLSIILYADDILLLAPTVSSLQQLLYICETELAWLDMSINVKKSSCIRVGPRYNSLCCNLTTLDGQEIMWTNKVRYLGVYLVSSKTLSCNYDLIKKSFYRAFNAIYGKVGRLASVNVVIELLKTKCMPILFYALEACPISSRQFRSLNHAVVSCARKIFDVNSSESAVECLKMFGVSDVAEVVATRKDRFVKRYALSSSAVCEICSVIRS